MELVFFKILRGGVTWRGSYLDVYGKNCKNENVVNKEILKNGFIDDSVKNDEFDDDDEKNNEFIKLEKYIKNYLLENYGNNLITEK